MTIQEQLKSFELNQTNCVIIGSGILNALGIRESEDIDACVNQETYDRLFADERLEHKENFGRIFLINDIFEVQTGWMHYSFNDLFENSVVIDGVRYNSLDFLLKIKKDWAAGENPRDKDVRDVKLIEDYLAKIQ